MLSEIEAIFKVPAFVKTASAEQLDTTSSKAVLVRPDLRIDTKPAVWLAEATLRKEAAEGQHSENYIRSQVDRALEIFGLSDSDFQIIQDPEEHFVVKTAGYEINTPIRTLSNFITIANNLLSKKASLPYEFRRVCANKLLGISKYAEDCGLPDNVLTGLLKEAGTNFTDAEAAKAEIFKRIEYARANKSDAMTVKSLEKTAELCDDIMNNTSRILSDEIAKTISMFDQQAGISDHLSKLGMSHIEDRLYLTGEENIRKEASKKLAVGEGFISKAAFMLGDSRARISKWASSCGLRLSDDMSPEACASAISKLNRYYLKDFFENFA